MSKVRDEVRAGQDARVTPTARAAGLPPSTLYSLIREGKIKARRVGGCVILPNAVAREILGLDEHAPA